MSYVLHQVNYYVAAPQEAPQARKRRTAVACVAPFLWGPCSAERIEHA